MLLLALHPCVDNGAADAVWLHMVRPPPNTARDAQIMMGRCQQLFETFFILVWGDRGSIDIGMKGYSIDNNQ